jgi:alpha-glucosidase
MRIITRATGCVREGSHFTVSTNEIDIRIWFLTDDIVRIRAGFDGDFHECSYSLCLTAWDDDADDLMKGYRRRVECAESTLEEQPDRFVMRGRHLVVTVRKSPYQLEISDAEDGTVLHRDCVDLALREDRNKRRLHTSEIDLDDGFFGFGEHGGSFDKNQSYLALFPTDAMGWDPQKTDCLYKHIPFYIRLRRSCRIATGYFYHTTAECDFDMGRRRSNYWHKSSTFRTDSGDIDLFFIRGPKVTDVIERYTDLTGKSAMLPKSALGYLGSSMYYSELEKDCDRAITTFADTAREEDIPLDGFQLSSGYCAAETPEGLKRCFFTWNRDRFPDPKAFFAEMDRRGITVSPNVKPGILKVHPMFEKMKEHRIFVRDEHKDEPAVGTWWGGPGCFADFTSPQTRACWKELLKENLFSYGCHSVWNDNCEYDSLVNKDSRCCLEGHGAAIGDIKSAQSSIFCHITVEALRESFKDKRPFVVCRSGHAGIQRYAQTWCGDNLTCWEALKYNIGTILGMSLSGVANQGADIGGFYGPAPEEELFVRWVQNGIFQPRFSIHSVNTDNTVTEPWMYSRTKKLVHDAIALRYRLSPYLYSMMRRAHVTGLPYFSPMLMEFQDDPKVYSEQENFMCGDALLVANVLEKGQTERRVYFPANEIFYSLDDFSRHEGGREESFPVTLSSIPMFLRAGRILVLSDTKLLNLARDKVRDLRVIASCDRDASFCLYEDDGVSNDYEKGVFRQTRISFKAGKLATMSFGSEGSYPSDLRSMRVVLINRGKCPFHVSVGGERIPCVLHRPAFEKAAGCCWHYSQTRRCVEIRIDSGHLFQKIGVSFEPFDMLGM